MAFWSKREQEPVTEAVGPIGHVIAHAEDASNFLKALSHEGRLTILCHLLEGPRSVTELETLLSSRQAAVSQQLARLRLEGLVNARREGHQIFYSLRDPRVFDLLTLLQQFYDPRADRRAAENGEDS